MNTTPHPRPLALVTTALGLLLLAGCATKVPLEGGEKPLPTVITTPPPMPPVDTNPIGKGDGSDTRLPEKATTLRRIVYFDFDSADIRADSQRDLEALAQHFRHAQTHGAIVLEGHADERGGREYNLALGQKRAEAVRRALALLGVPGTRMEAISWGEEKPATPGKDEQAFSLNRRVELPPR